MITDTYDARELAINMLPIVTDILLSLNQRSTEYVAEMKELCTPEQFDAFAREAWFQPDGRHENIGEAARMAEIAVAWIEWVRESWNTRDIKTFFPGDYFPITKVERFNRALHDRTLVRDLYLDSVILNLFVSAVAVIDTIGKVRDCAGISREEFLDRLFKQEATWPPGVLPEAEEEDPDRDEDGRCFNRDCKACADWSEDAPDSVYDCITTTPLEHKRLMEEGLAELEEDKRHE